MLSGSLLLSDKVTNIFNHLFNSHMFQSTFFSVSGVVHWTTRTFIVLYDLGDQICAASLMRKVQSICQWTRSSLLLGSKLQKQFFHIEISTRSYSGWNLPCRPTRLQHLSWQEASTGPGPVSFLGSYAKWQTVSLGKLTAVVQNWSPLTASIFSQYLRHLKEYDSNCLYYYIGLWYQ